jgi:Cell Wall Hydrolase
VTDETDEPEQRTFLRWIFLALGLIAIIVAALTTGSPEQKSRPPVTVPLDPDVVEPAPLAFQPNIAPEDAESMNAERPDYVGPIVAARPFIALKGTAHQADLDRATECLTQAVYYEAASESPAGQRAVAQVVLNRVRDPRYPPSVCGVVYQGHDRATGCQFTFTCDGALTRKPDPFLYMRARMVAVAALSGMVEPLVGLATHYHTKQVVPIWRTDLVKLRTVGAHIFYGWQGSPRGLRGLRTSYAGIEPEIFPVPFTSGLSPDILPTIEDEGSANPFAAPVPDSPLAGPKLPAQDFGRMRADDAAGELVGGQSGKLEADNQAGTLNPP